MKRFEPKVTETLDDSLSPASNRAVNEKLNGTVLYSDTTGTTGNITLSEDISQYKYIELYGSFKDKQISKKINLSGSTIFCIDGMVFDGPLLSYNFSTSYTVDGKTITVGYHGNFVRSYETGSITGDNSDNFLIINKVIGYK